MQPQDPSPSPFASSEASTQRRPLLPIIIAVAVTAVVVGVLALGAGGVGGYLMGRGGSGSTGGADGDLDTACTLLASVTEESLPLDDGGSWGSLTHDGDEVGVRVLEELAAVGTLVRASSYGDDGSQDSEQNELGNMLVAAATNWDADGINDAADGVRAECDAR